MKAVGIRELKAKLSEYLRHIQNGESISVTDRGKTIARLSPSLDYPDLGTYDGSSAVRDPGIAKTVPSPDTPRNAAKTKSYTELLKETQKAWGYKTPKETLRKALEEHLRYKKQMGIFDLAGTIDYDPAYDYKAARRKR